MIIRKPYSSRPEHGFAAHHYEPSGPAGQVFSAVGEGVKTSNSTQRSWPINCPGRCGLLVTRAHQQREKFRPERWSAVPRPAPVRDRNTFRRPIGSSASTLGHAWVGPSKHTTLSAALKVAPDHGTSGSRPVAGPSRPLRAARHGPGREDGEGERGYYLIPVCRSFIYLALENLLRRPFS